MVKLFFPFFLSVNIFIQAGAQKLLPAIQTLTSGTNTSLRGLSVVNNEIIWVSGSNGTVARSANGGKDWKWMIIKDFEKFDFRDIEAFDASRAVVMSVGEPAYILKTYDGGDSWKVVYENKAKGMFLDGMEFWNEQAGIVIGDPVDSKFFIARTFDGGNTWKPVPTKYLPVADSGETCFAASGTNIRALDLDEAAFVSGGAVSNIFIKDTKIHLPLIQGKQSTGANSIAVWDRFRKNGGKRLVVVGGDFSSDTLSFNNCFYSLDRGKTWKEPKKPPHGYRSCVEYLAKNQLITCGLTGVDYSFDNANTWELISQDSFHVCKIAKMGTSVFLAGNKGRIAKLVFGGK